MTDKQQTAVQWLYKQLNSSSTNNTFIKPELIQQALEMEREQIEQAYNQGIEATFKFNYGDGKRYFTETYKQP